MPTPHRQPSSARHVSASRYAPTKAILALSAVVGFAPLTTAQNCQRSAGTQPPAVVELFTSQGCSSCPPADRWLSTLKGDESVIALSFHVNYWNYLGWKDPYATPETTERQRRIQKALHGTYVYTPQVVLNGRDHRQWRGQAARALPKLPAEQAPALSLSRAGDLITAQVGAQPGRSQLAGYWAVLHNGLSQQVTRGENAGARLVNDHVVSLYQPVAAWNAQAAHTVRLMLPPNMAAQRVVFIVTDEDLTQPLQGLALQCS
jgi:hypothetical protein